MTHLHDSKYGSLVLEYGNGDPASIERAYLLKCDNCQADGEYWRGITWPPYHAMCFRCGRCRLCGGRHTSDTCMEPHHPRHER